MVHKVSTIILKVDLGCQRCHDKIKKVLCKYRERFQIEKEIFDEKNNTVTISGPFCPCKLMKKLCCKAGKVIEWYKIVEEKPPEPPKPKPPPPPKPEPPPPPPPAPEPKPPPPPPPAPAPEPCPPPPPAPAPEPPPPPPPVPEPKPPPPPPPPQPEPEPEPCEPCPPPVQPRGVCCGPCYEGHGGGPCELGYGRQPVWFDDCARPPPPCYCGCGRSQQECNDGYGRPPPPPPPCYERPSYRSNCTTYFSDENPNACTVM